MVVCVSSRACDRTSANPSADSSTSIDRSADDNARASNAASSNTSPSNTDAAPSHADATAGFSNANRTRDLVADSASDSDITTRDCFANANRVPDSYNHDVNPNSDNDSKPNTRVLSI